MSLRMRVRIVAAVVLAAAAVLGVFVAAEPSATWARLAMLIVVLCALGILLATAWLDKLALARLVTMSHAVREISESADVTKQIPTLGHDELTALGYDINAMLARICQMTEDLASMAKAAEAASRSKSRFLANMSHELRTPMNAILGMTRLARETVDDEDRSDMLRIVESSAVALIGVLEDVLDLSKVEAGRMELRFEPFELAASFVEAVSLLEPSATQKGLSLTTEVSPDLPSWVLGDEYRYRQIVVNLVGNAVKFTSEGAVAVYLEPETKPGAAAASNAGRVFVRLTVADTGIGISVDRQQEIFEAFTQEDSSVSRHYGGTGLGLTITSRLVTLMGGVIDVESGGTGTGATFTVTVPFAPATSRPESGLDEATGELPGNLAVLIAEDNPVNRKVLLSTLRSLGCSVDAVSDGRSAVLAVRKKVYDLILMDVQMPEMDGIEATRQIRAAEEATGRHTPIIAVTAHAMAGDREACLAAGMDTYLPKPFDAEDLAAVMSEALNVGPGDAVSPLTGRR